MPADSLPLRIGPAPQPIDPELEPLLTQSFSSALEALEASSIDPAAPAAVRGRLLDRLQASRAASATMVNRRWRQLPPLALAEGVSQRLLYAAPGGRPLRPGEPLRARLVELQPGSHWQGPAPDAHREWLVLRGSARIGAEPLALRDYHVRPAGSATAAVASDEGGLLFLRESTLAATAGDAPFTVRDADAGWPEFAPGIRRRVLWQRDGQAALLYNAEAGAMVPHHTHGHDEECLMVQGELFLDDLLLQTGDYQLAPVGTEHRITETDTGVVIYAHGDLDMKFMA